MVLFLESANIVLIYHLPIKSILKCVSQIALDRLVHSITIRFGKMLVSFTSTSI